MFDDICSAIKNADRILIVTHTNPDGDAIGSSLGFHLSLKEMGKVSFLALETSPPQMFSFLDGIDEAVVRPDINEINPDLILALDAADQKRGIESGVREDPREDRRGCRLSVRTGDGHGGPVVEKKPPQRAGKTRVLDAAIDGRARLGVVAPDRVADHHEVRARRQVRGFVPLENGDPLPLQIRGHRRIDVRIAARDAMPRGLEDPRERPHARPANGDEMNVHREVNPRAPL